MRPDVQLLREAFKLALSIMLAYWLALAMNWQRPGYSSVAIAIISMGTNGAAFNKGLRRLVGTLLGVLVGFAILAAFDQSVTGTYLSYLALIGCVGYMMLSSRQSYAWYVTGFVSIIVWSTTYQQSDLGKVAFTYGAFRFLETAAGIVIYTLVSTLLWPVRAAMTLPAELSSLFGTLIGIFDRAAAMAESPAGDSRTSPADRDSIRLASQLSDVYETISAARSDSPRIREHGRAWKILRINLRGLADVLRLWEIDCANCRGLDLDALIPGIGDARRRLRARLERLREYCAPAPPAQGDPADAEALEAIPLHLDPASVATIHPGRLETVCLHSLLWHWRILERLSRELLHSFRRVHHRVTRSAPQPVALVPDPHHRFFWNPHLAYRALFPMACFSLIWVFWLYTNPPSGAGTVAITTVYAFMLLLNPVPPKILLLVLVSAITLLYTPMYFFVLPALDSGPPILVTIFIYSFIAGLLGSINQLFKMIPIVLLTMMALTGDQPSFSFTSYSHTVLMFILALAAIIIVDMLVRPRRPEDAFLGALRRFFHDASLALGIMFQPGKNAARLIETRLYPAPRELDSYAAKLTRGLPAGDSGETIGGLANTLQTLVVQLKSINYARARLEREHTEDFLRFQGEFISLLGRCRGEIDRLFRLETAAPGDGASLRDALWRLESRMETEVTDAVGGPLLVLHSLFSSMRGMLETLDGARDSMRPLDFPTMERTVF